MESPSISTDCKPEPMDSEDDLFVMFTSGVTGKPKGIVHSQAGYLLQVAVTHKVWLYSNSPHKWRGGWEERVGDHPFSVLPHSHFK